MAETLILGLTGPTGAGKSTAARAMLACGCRVIDADRVAREVVKPGSPCLLELIKAFGGGILRPDGTLNRAVLASLAFATEEKTRRLNAVTHPWITREIREKIEEYRDRGEPLVVLDAPLLLESGEHALCGAVAVVTAPEPVRLRRIMERDGITPEQARLRISAQPGEDFYTQQADYVLDGSGRPDCLYQATERLVAALREEQHV